MASAIEAMGMSLPYSSSNPAEDPLKKLECRMAGRQVDFTTVTAPKGNGVVLPGIACPAWLTAQVLQIYMITSLDSICA